STHAPEPDPASIAGRRAYPVPDAAAYLTGRWSVQRELSDVCAGLAGTFCGTAVFRHPAAATADSADAGADCLLHIEEGELRWNGATAPASRTLRLLPHPDGTARVTFADGRPFHDLDLRTGHWSAHHPCSADRYEGEFTAISDDEWHLRWQVTGPAKNQ